MSARAARLAWPLLLILAACGGASDDGGGSEAGIEGRIDCALEGAQAFARDCTLTEMEGADGTVLVVGRADSGYRRLAVTDDGRGVIAADGAEPATVTIIGDGVIEVAVGSDRYRLPADTGGAN